MAAYYNENDPYQVQWLENLIACGLLPYGHVDNRSIVEVRPNDLAGYHQHHFFAGLGIWPLALRSIGWPDSGRIWTGSCPCQPFSGIGQQLGFDDQRHLWPAWFHLITQFAPSCILGEQVDRALPWLDLVQADLEAACYAFAAADICAAGFGGAHIRQRLFFAGLGHAFNPRLEGYAGHGHGGDEPGWVTPETHGSATPAGLFHGAEWRDCGGGIARPVQPGLRLVAPAHPSRVGRLRAYGNALDLEATAQFCRAVMEAA